MLSDMDTPTASRTDLNQAVAAEIRALLARRRMRQSAFATQLGQTEVWVSRRLRGIQALSLDDLEGMCRVLRVEPADLISAALRADPETYQCSFPLADRPTDNRPPGRTDRQVTRGDRSTSRPASTRRPRVIGTFTAVPRAAGAR